jgi:glucuronosyltransferase
VKVVSKNILEINFLFTGSQLYRNFYDMKTLVLVLVLGSLSIITPTVQPAKIVVTYLVGTKSQLISFMPIVEELAQRGHDVTVVTAYRVPITDKSIRLIHLADLDAELESFTPDWFGMSKEGAKQILTMATSMKSMYFSGYECLMRNKEFQSLIQANDIDLMIVD